MAKKKKTTKKATKKKATRKAAKKTTKKATKKKATKKAAKKTTKKAAKKATKKTAKKKRKANPALLRPLQPSADLAQVVGSKPLPRGQVMKKIWAHVKANGLQDKSNGQYIHTDDKLKKLLGKSKVHMTEFGKLLKAPHLT